MVFRLRDGRLLAVEESAIEQGDLLNALLSVSDWVDGAVGNGAAWIKALPATDVRLIAYVCGFVVTIFPKSMGCSGRWYAGIDR